MAARKENPPGVDELYGLEPVFEPGNGEPARASADGVQPQAVQCPYCGEVFDTMVDLSAGSTSYIEDCQVCCQPIEFRLEVAADGTLAGLQLGRGD
ncbi:MAG TPA: CPXCG motif-containing cysteine-rich protein [Steroidobacteraceae bacterium]|nr:CPXCG motif-containing cysteine-rich protein [Steroidobacteraceae bacterium]